MDNLADTASLLWKEVSREARTSIGRRLSSSSKSRPIEKPPPGAHGLVLQEPLRCRAGQIDGILMRILRDPEPACDRAEAG